MRHRTLLTLSRLAGTALLVLLAACGGGSSGGHGSAQLRLVNLSTTYASLDLVTNNENVDNDDDKVQATGIVTGKASSFAEVDADDYTVKLRRTGATAALRTFSAQAFVDETVATYVAYNNASGFGVLTLEEDLDKADSGKVTFRAANLSTAGALDVYLTDASTQLSDTTPVISSVTSTASSTTVDSGEYRLRITANGDSSDVRLDVPSITLTSRGVVTLMLTETAGGILVNGVLMPQQGEPTLYDNTSLRIRGAMALGGGAVATLRVSGQSLFSSGTAGVIGARYLTMASGQPTVALTVNGAQVPVTAPTLAAGRDYTMLVWSNADGTHVTTIEDDNKPVLTSGRTRIRLLNGMSTSGQPLTLSMDYSPIIEAIQPGEASTSTETFPGTELRLDVIASNTGQAIITRTDLTLVSGGIYTFFATQNPDGTLGVLRKDR